ncbi:MAG: hypothetical protein ACWGMZ_04475 [Thermoguttaceae bacterium]
MIGGRRFFHAALIFCAFFCLVSASLAQAPADNNDSSIIFPSITRPSKRKHVVWPEIDVRQTSPTQQIAFEDVAGATLADGQTNNNYVPYSDDLPPFGSQPCCPHCGQPLDDEILDSCPTCSGPGRRLLHRLIPIGIGRGFFQPPQGREPWITRPFSAGVFIGPIVGSPLLDDWVGQQTGTLAGARFGWDMDDDWGVETRFASANIPLYDSAQAIQAANLLDQSAQQQLRLQGTRNADHFLWDIEVLYYPWGDAACRPYVLFGLGIARIECSDRLGASYARILAGMPLGLGIKSRLNDWLVFRVECTDNVAFAGGSIFETQHNASVTGALEVRLGRSRINYWPWNPGK